MCLRLHLSRCQSRQKHLLLSWSQSLLLSFPLLSLPQAHRPFRVGFFLSGLEYIFFPSLEEICLTCVCYFFKVSPICFISIRRLIRRKDVFLCAVNILDCCFFLRDYNDDTIIIGFFLIRKIIRKFS